MSKTYTDKNGKFAVGNPGRPKGSRHKSTLAVEALLDGQAEAISQKAVDNISNLGGAGISGALSRSFLRFFEEFGEEKLINIIQANLNLSSKEIVDTIVNEVKLHSAKVEQSDDITIMVIKRNS